MKMQTTAQPETIFDRELRPLVDREVMSNPAPATSAAVRDVLAERQRQIEVEGWTPEHDDARGLGDMAMAGACYAAHAACREAIERGDLESYGQLNAAQVLVGRMWPWGREWWKPKNSRRDLVRAAALIIAEIERMDRAKS